MDFKKEVIFNNKKYDNIGEATEEIKDGLMEAMQKAFEYTLQHLYGKVKEFAPVDHGRLQGSFMMEIMKQFKGRVYTNVIYAPAVNWGSGIYSTRGDQRVIKPSNRDGFIVFKIDGRKIYAREIKGQKPQFYVERAIKDSENKLDDFIQKALKETVRRWE